MSKKLLIIISAVLFVVILGGAGGYFVFRQRVAAPAVTDQSLTANSLPAQQAGSETLTAYQDASGFSFNYPQSLVLKDTTPDDPSYYSQIELSKSGQSLKISITDGNTNPYKNNTAAKLVGSTTLGGISSNQYALGSRLVSVAIDQGVLYVIDGPKDGGYWENTQNNILTSFKFGTQTNTAASDANTTYEEEVVE